MIFSQFIGNRCFSAGSLCIYNYASLGVLYVVCIFQQNYGQSYSGSGSVIIQSSYIYHINSIRSPYTFDDVKTGSINTQTFTLQHLSTMYCQDIPCQTLPQARVTNYIILQSTTECSMITDSNSTPLITLSKVFHVGQMALFLVSSVILCSF